MKILGDMVSLYYYDTRDKMPEAGAWNAMDDEALWGHLTRIIIAMGRSAPSYDLFHSKDFEFLSIGSMKKFRITNGTDALIKRTHAVLAKYNVRYCSPLKDTSVKARTIVDNLNEPAIVQGTDFVLLDGMRHASDPRFYLMERVNGYGMKSASEFLIEIGYSKNYMAFDSRLKRVFSMIFARDFDSCIRTPRDYMDFEELFREEICPELCIMPSELDAIVFWNYGSILKSLKH